MARKDTVSYHNYCLILSGQSLQRELSADNIDKVLVCVMEDQIHHGDEQFHIVVLEDEFVVLGSFVEGALKAISQFLSEHLDIKLHYCRVRRIPYKYRLSGFLGLRPFPIAGLYAGPRQDLVRFGLKSEEGEI